MIPAILVSMPGTGAAVATSRDGYKLIQQGKSRKALDMALTSSVFGDTCSDIFTLLIIFPIAYLFMQFGSPELFAVLLLSPVIIASTSRRNPLKSLCMMPLGLWLSFIGTDPLGSVERFPFGVFDSKSGITLLPMLIGVFAIPELVSVVKQSEKVQSLTAVVGARLSFTELRRCVRTICRSTVLGSVIGIVPGLASLM